MGRLTTHVLDLCAGKPGRGIAVTLFRLAGEARTRVAAATTNADGRCDAPLLEGAHLQAGRYEIVFDAGRYLRAAGHAVTEPAFLDDIVIRFGIASPDQHYHVPLLLSPFGYSTYRGS